MPLNQGSVTIVPTVTNNPRPRNPTLRGQTRRGRPPMSAQYALGQVIPKGMQKSQMAVRIMRKQVMSGRGGKSFQTIAVPVSSGTPPHALLNKSVVITPANRGSSTTTSKMVRTQKSLVKQGNPNIGGKHSGVSVSLIPSTSGIKGQKMHASSSSILDTAKELARKASIPVLGPDGKPIRQSDSKELGMKPLASKLKSLNSPSGDELSSDEENLDDLNPLQDSDDSNLDNSSLNDDQSLNQSMGNESSLGNMSNQISNLSSNDIMCQTSDQMNLNSFSENMNTDNIASSQNSPASAANVNTLNDMSSSQVGLDLREHSKSSTGEPLTGIVKPLIQQTNKPPTSLTPLESMSNLVPPDTSSLPITQTQNFSTPGDMNASSFPSSSSQPLFQPFLQHPFSSTSSTTSNNSSGTTTSSCNSPSSSILASNVAHVSPQVQTSTPPNFSSSPSFISSTLANFPMQGIPSLTTTAAQTTLPSFSSASDTTQNTSNSTLPSISHITGSQPTTTSAGGEGPLSLSNLLGGNSFDQSTENTPSAHPTSALDYLNYSLSAGTSAFRRPDFPTSLTSDLQSLLTSSAPPLASGSLPTPPPAHSNSSPSVTSGSFTSQSSAYSQYAAAYRPHSGAPGFRSPPSMTPGTYTSYPSQYPYPGQYAGLAPPPTPTPPHTGSTPQPPTMGQYGSLQSTANPYQTYPAPGTGLPPYSPGLSGFGHGPYPPM